MAAESIIYFVCFEQIPGRGLKSIYLFGSLSAIFDKFTAEDIGLTLRDLWERGMKVGDVVETPKKATIIKTTIYRKKQKSRRSC